MQAFDRVIRNGTVATASDVFHADIGIRAGKIVAIGESLAPGREETDAEGMYVLPGGVDAHCHIAQPMGEGVVMADNFDSGTHSALCGGTTTVIPFAAQARGQSLREAVADYHRSADGMARCDYAFHLIVADANPAVLQNELPALIEEGYTSFKIYMTYDDLKLDDRQILEVLAVARREGAMTMIHAENHDCITWLTELLEAAGRNAPRFHGEAHNSIVEREATHRAISLAELVDVPMLIVHVSGAEAIEQIHWAQGRGMRIYAETCPQYLFLTAEDLGLDDFEGAKCVCSPPPRDAGNQEKVWAGLENGVFQVFSSDHAPFRYEDSQGKKVAGEKASFRYIPNGVPGLETRLPLLFSAGVGTGRLSLSRFVELTATNPAKIYGLYPQKGTIATGADADLVLWDPDKKVTITNADLHHDVDYTPYEGMQVTGWPIMTFLRGQLVMENGKIRVQPGHGQFLRCQRPEAAKTRKIHPILDL